MITTAYIKIWGELVGAVAWDEKSRVAGFEYSEKFKTLSWELSPIKMPLHASSNFFSFPELRKQKGNEFDTFKGLPGLLADVLPDKYGNQLIDIWLAHAGRPPGSMNPVEMLCFIGTRGMGALEFDPAHYSAQQKSVSLELDNLVATAKKMLRQKEKFVVNLKQDDARAALEILKTGTSAGGARPKAVIAYNEKTAEVRSGQTTAPKGFSQWLIKLDGVSAVQLGASSGYGRVEMAYYNMARASGIDMMPCKLLEENGRAHFMTKRFDRDEGNVKHHIQTFCAIKHFDFNEVLSFSYEQLFQTMRELKLSYPEAEQMYRRMVFNVLAKNCDDHTKNFAFRLKQKGQWELAPAYDLCHAYKPLHRWVNQHSLSINGKRDKITRSDLLSVAASVNIKNADEIIDEISAQVKQWRKFADETGVDPALRKEIAQTLVKM